MTVRRTNLATNPSVEVNTTNYSYYPGNGGVVTAARATTDPRFGLGSYRATWTTASTGGSPGVSYQETVSGVAGDVRSASVWVRASQTRSIRFLIRFRNGTTIVTDTFAPTVSIPANTWVELKCENSVATGSYNNILLWALPVSPGFTFAVGDTMDMDAVTIAVGPVVPGSYFDGSFPSIGNISYRWVGAANASASEEYYALPTVLVEELEPSPAPSVGITVVALGATPTVFNVWRVAAGRRTLVRGGRNREAVDSDYLEDYEVPFNIPVTYEVEIISGPSVTLQTYSGTITVTSAVGWMQDPLVPSSAIPVDGYSSQDGRPVLMSPSLSELLYEADVSYMKVMGSADPVALIGQRASAAGVNFSMVTKAAEHTNDLRDLTMSGGILLVRPVAPWGDPLPPLCYIAPGTVKEGPRLSRTGDPNSGTDWDVTSPLVKAPSMDVLVPRWTWGDVEALYATWGQAETALAGKTWLDVTKNPTGA